MCLEDQKVIDSHLHLADFNQEINLSLITDLIERGLVSYLSYKPGQEFEGNKKVLKLQEKYPSKFLAKLWVNPLSPNWQAKVKGSEKKYTAIKIHPEANKYKVSTEILKPVFKFANENNLPITTHTSEFVKPSAFEELLTIFPKVKVIFAHLSPLQESTRVAKKFKNAWLETSYTDLSDFLVAYQTCGAEKIIFGSDYPSLPKYHTGRKQRKEQYKKDLGKVLDTKYFSKKDIEKIVHSNAKNVFNI